MSINGLPLVFTYIKNIQDCKMCKYIHMKQFMRPFEYYNQKICYNCNKLVKDTQLLRKTISITYRIHIACFTGSQLGTQEEVIRTYDFPLFKVYEDKSGEVDSTEIPLYEVGTICGDFDRYYFEIVHAQVLD